MTRVLIILLLVQCAVACRASSVIIGGFSYYADRSPESVVDEIALNGFDDVRIVGNNATTINAPLVKAFSQAKVKTWLLTFSLGSYGTQGLPQGWEQWRMKLRKTENHNTGFTFFCPNNLAYREWKKKDIAAALKANPFYGVDLAEPQMPAYNGPESDDYGCVCDTCVNAFKHVYPDAPGIPDFNGPKSPHYWKTDRTLYDKWVGFRVASVVSFLDDIVNGKGGIREKCPDAKVAAWSLGLDVADPLAKLREYYGLDAAAIAKRVKPDVFVVQTDWPDWTKSDLDPEYVLKYKPVVDSIKDASPKTTLMLQSDIGSQAQMRRSREWMKQLEEAARKIGLDQVTSYEYFLGDFIYTDKPAPVKAVFEDPSTVKISFNKRLDPGSAASLANYSIDTGRIDFVKVDGNIVRLSVSAAGQHPTITISGLSDDESRRFFHDKPACTMQTDASITVE